MIESWARFQGHHAGYELGKIFLQFFNLALHHCRAADARSSPKFRPGKAATSRRQSVAVALMLASLFLLCTWPALLTLLEHSTETAAAAYLPVLLAAVFGQTGESKTDMPSFFTQITQMQDNWPSVLIAMVGGIALGLGNLISQHAWAFAGLSVTNIICASLTVVIGFLMMRVCTKTLISNQPTSIPHACASPWKDATAAIARFRDIYQRTHEKLL